MNLRADGGEFQSEILSGLCSTTNPNPPPHTHTYKTHPQLFNPPELPVLSGQIETACLFFNKLWVQQL